MKSTYKKIMHVACGQGLRLGSLLGYLMLFEKHINKYANTDKLDISTIKETIAKLKNETTLIIMDNNRIIGVADDLK